MKLPFITQISLNNCRLGNQGAKHLSKLETPRLRILWLRENNIFIDGFAFFLLGNWNELNYVSMYNFNFGQRHLQAVAISSSKNLFCQNHTGFRFCNYRINFQLSPQFRERIFNDEHSIRMTSQFYQKNSINNVNKIIYKFIIMSSAGIQINKQKLSPLNLTSQAVHLILKQAPKQVPSLKKIYPTAKYGTEEIRSTTQVNNHISKKIKQLQRMYSEQKNPKFMSPQGKRETIILKAHRGRKVQIKQNFDEDRVLDYQRIPDAEDKRNYLEDKKSAQKYFDKINKIKSLKLKQYMRNKFAIEAKTIETTREDKLPQENYAVPLIKYPKVLYRKKQLRSETESKQQVVTENVYEIANEVSGDEKKITEDKRNHSLFEIKFQKATKKAERLQKTQVIEKNFQFCREFEDHPADIRFQRMNQHLNFILFSFGCTRSNCNLQPYSRNCFKYKYFVGPGNNRNIIVQTMKKRWWWSQTIISSQAHFVWTQIKQPKVFEVCEQYSNLPSFSLLPEKPEKTKLESSPTALKKFKQKLKQQKGPRKIFHSTIEISSDNLALFKNGANKFKKIDVPRKLHNHYHGNSNLGNKKALFHFLSSYCEYKNLNKYDYIPLTFHITGQRGLDAMKIEKIFDENPDVYWLIKPGQNSNRGNGISITKSSREVIEKAKQLTTNSLILQKYIDDLFLYCHRKFDIRTYMIAITIGGSTKFYWHQQGYLRTSSFSFNFKDINNIYVHLTNDAIQSTNDGYGRFQQGNKLSYQQFQRYLDQNYHNKNYSIKRAHDQMRNIAQLAVRAVYPKLNSGNLQFAIELFGLDFILDSKFKPWLIQINTNPCLQLNSTCLERLIPQVIENAFRLGLDPVFPPNIEFPRSMSSFVPDSILASNRFCLIFDDLFDRDLDWESNICRIPNVIKEEDEQQGQYQESKQN